jgi:hypothetical protein
VESSSQIAARLDCCDIMFYMHIIVLSACLLLHSSAVMALLANNASVPQWNTEGMPLQQDVTSLGSSTAASVSTSDTSHLPTSGGHLNESQHTDNRLSTSVHIVFTTASVNLSSNATGSNYTSAVEHAENTTTHVQSTGSTSSLDVEGASKTASHMETNEQVITHQWQTTADGALYTDVEMGTKETALDSRSTASSGTMTVRSCCPTSVTAVDKIDHSLIKVVTSPTPIQFSKPQQKSNKSDVSTDGIIAVTSYWIQPNSSVHGLQLSSTTTALPSMTKFSLHFLTSLYSCSFVVSFDNLLKFNRPYWPHLCKSPFICIHFILILHHSY